MSEPSQPSELKAGEKDSPLTEATEEEPSTFEEIPTEEPQEVEEEIPGGEEQEDQQEDHSFKVNDRRFWNIEDEELEQEGQRPSLPSYVEQLKAQLQEKEEQLREYIKAYKQEVGEGLEKTKQRLERDAAQQMDQMRGKLAEPMLEVLDAIERSVEAGQQTNSLESLLQGMEMVHMLMTQKLQEMGLTRIPCVGQPFDPAMHEALALAPVTDPAQDNVVVREFKPGFILGQRVVRPAQVQVGKLG